MKKRCDCHCHTVYSNTRLSDSINTIEGLIDRAHEIELAGIAITDHELLSGHLKALEYVKKYEDLKLILGNEIYLVDERPSKTHYHFILLAKDNEGHHQLKELSSLAWINSYSAKGLERVDTLKEDLERVVKRNPGHLIASTACLGGELSKLILELEEAEYLETTEVIQEKHNAIVNFVLWCKDIFKDDFYLEIQPGTSKEQIKVNKRMVSLSKAFGLKMMVTSDAHYLKKEDRWVHKAFLNSKDGDREVDSFYESCFLHDEDEMREGLYKSEFDDKFIDNLFENSMEIYNKIKGYDLTHKQRIPDVEVKNYEKKEAPVEFKNCETLSKMFMSDDIYDRYWANECFAGLENKVKDWRNKKEYIDELEEEAEVKKTIGDQLDTNMFKYPVLLQHYIDMIWEAGSAVGSGRGSACAALNHYLLGLNQLDPIEWDMQFFRYMNREAVGLGDIDLDLAPSIRPIWMERVKEERQRYLKDDLDEDLKSKLGAVFVGTFGKESTKSAIATAARGYRGKNGEKIDSDVSLYLSSLIPVERGFIWGLNDVVHGNEEKGRKPVTQFVNEVNRYEGLLDVVQGIENLINRRGIHASGIIMLDGDPFEKCAFMKAPNGEITTQFDLEDCEKMGLVKLDMLVTEAVEKLTLTLRLLQEYGYIEKELSLREAYDKYLHPDAIDLNDAEVWKNIDELNTIGLFQFDSEVGSRGVRELQPVTIEELSNVNGLIRLTNDGAGSPIEKYKRFKSNAVLWEREMNSYGLSEKEKQAVRKYLSSSYGVGFIQEQLMLCLMDKDICNFSLREANMARKIVAKKKIKDIPKLKAQIESKASSIGMGKYIWDCVVGPQRSYAFNRIHSISYSIISYQTAYVATHWNPIYWNTASLIVNSGAATGKTTAYEKIAVAVGELQSKGVEVSLLDINESSHNFKPDEKNNKILFGLKAADRISDDIIDMIVKGRPYESLLDFMNKCKIGTLPMVSLIKGGAFDKTDSSWANQVNPDDPRRAILYYYLMKKSDLKKRITLQNLSGLIKYDLVPKEKQYDDAKIVRNLNKFLGKHSYKLNINDYNTMTEMFEDEFVIVEMGEDYVTLDKKQWDKFYQKHMNVFREWINNHYEEVLKKYNYVLLNENLQKYASGNISKWEMDSLCFYYHEHELSHVDKVLYGIKNFKELSSEPEVERVFEIKGKRIPIYKLDFICGTVIGKNKTRHIINLLTSDGVINVKVNKDYFAFIDKQISEVNDAGEKHVIEKSWLKRGNLLLIKGYRDGDQFRAKNYKSKGGHTLYKIDKIYDDGELALISADERGKS